MKKVAELRITVGIAGFGAETAIGSLSVPLSRGDRTRATRLLESAIERITKRVEAKAAARKTR